MMNPNCKTTAGLLALAAPILFTLSTVAMLGRVEPFHTHYYSFAWWCYIAFLQSLLYRKTGGSALFDNPGRFILLSFLSLVVWLLFEAINFRLVNWRYVNVPHDVSTRWFGYLIAYSTVLPGLFSTFETLKFTGIFRDSSAAPLPDARKLYKPFILAGVALMILPLAWPRFFFPAVWLAFIFLLEPLNHRFGAPSLLRDWEDGSFRNFYLLLLSGAVCGLLWELWNFRAGAKWVYAIPYLDFLKVFEMPILGFFGFPPFAVECYAITSSFFLLTRSVRRRFSPPVAVTLFAFTVLLALIYSILVLTGIDHWTILFYQKPAGYDK